MNEKTPLHLQKPLVVNHHNATTVTVNDETTTQPEHSHRSSEIPKHHCEGLQFSCIVCICYCFVCNNKYAPVALYV